MAACCPPQGQRGDRAIRGVPMGQDCISPPHHTAFSTPIEMMQFIAEMRRCRAASRWASSCASAIVGVPGDLQGDAGDRHLPRLHRGRRQGGRHRRRALEFIDHIGMPMREGVTSCTTRWSASARAIASRSAPPARSSTAFDIARAMALGADWCNSARGFMFAVGCIQSQSCHTDRCPTGVATQDPTRQRALVVPDKMQRVANFHRATLSELAELTAAAGLDHPTDFKPIHITRRVSPSVVATYADLYPRGGGGPGTWPMPIRSARRPERAQTCCESSLVGPAIGQPKRKRP
jgi:hypothetical protein